MDNAHVNIKDNTTGEFIKTKTLLIQIPIRELHNWLIKPPSYIRFSGARLESGEVIIGDKSFKKYASSGYKS